jgi:glycosyltransferase involved in cell wall biosynthesis
MSEHPAKYTVSVVIPAYNIAEYIARAIESVLAQTRKPEEIVVVDDGSTDGTAEVIKKYLPHVKYVYQENRGLAGARNTGIRNSTCDFVAFLDGDDEWLPRFLELQMCLLERNPLLAWSVMNYRTYLHSENRGTAFIEPGKARAMLGGRDFFESYFDAFLRGAGGNCDAIVIRRNVFEAAGYFDEHLRFAEDWDMWLRIAYRYPAVGYVPEEGAIYYLDRPGSLMHDTANPEKIRTNCGIMDKHIALSQALGKYDDFSRCAQFMLRIWIRGLLFYRHEKPDIIYMLDRYRDLLPALYRLWIRCLLVWPWATAEACHAISKVVRTFGLRRQVIRKSGK